MGCWHYRTIIIFGSTEYENNRLNTSNLSPSTEVVILLHGLARTNRSMLKIESALKSAGYQTYNCNYPSRKQAIELLSETFIGQAIEYCEQTYSPQRIHFVTHSMGGILTRYYLSQLRLKKLGRVVMLAPPNAGSELVDRLSGLQLFRLINGPAAEQLGTAESSLPNSLGAVDYEVGVIAGNKSVNVLTSAIIGEENDGKVSTTSARLEGMTDYIVLPYTHTFMMNRSEVIEQTLSFLKNGAFQHSD
ncbi:MAG: triacylglycerol lipase [Gammaproteobacteria bacterium]